MTMPPLELVCLGAPTARLAGAEPPMDVLWRKHLALLVYLARSPHYSRTREHLVGMLWPEKEQDAARHSLSEALRRLRAGLGAARLVSEGETVSLSSHTLEVDASLFEECVSREPDRALALYCGDFLEGFALGDAEAFDEWASGERARLRARAVEITIACGERALAQGRLAPAADFALRARALEPLAELPVRLLMRARGLAGDAASALAAFHSYAQLLHAELDEEPGPALLGLAERLRQGDSRPSTAEPVEDEPVFVGVGPEVAEAFAEAASALQGGGPRTLIVMGAAGMGRSRLLAEVLKRARLDGAVIVAARALPADQDAPWSALRQLLGQGLATAPGLLAADPDSVGVVAFFAPALAERVSPVAPRDVGHVARALATIVTAVAGERPLALVLDDAHWADGTSLAALHGAVRALGRAPIFAALSVGDDIDAAPRELLALSADVGGAVPGAIVRLAPLDLAATQELVRALAPAEGAEDVGRLARRLVVETGGSPYWSVTLLRALRSSAPVRSELLAWPPRTRTYDAPLPPGVPALARLAAASRLAALAERERHVLLALAALGGAQDPGVVAAVCARARESVDAALNELERAQLVVFANGRYGFATPLLGTVLRTVGIQAGERERMRGRAIAALEGRPDDVEAAVLAAELRAEHGPSSEALAAAVAAGRAALAAGTARAAVRALRAAERAADPSDPRALDVVKDLRRETEAAGGLGTG